MPDILKDRVDSFGMPLVEMARIGETDSYSFWVYTEPLKNPSFHLRHRTDFEIVLQMKDYKILEVKFNRGRLELTKGSQPPKVLLDLMTGFFSAKNRKSPKLTNAEVMEILWDAVNPASPKD